MSEDEQIPFNNSVYDKLIELEEKIEERGENFKIYNIYADMNKKIAELEKKLDEHGQIWNRFLVDKYKPLIERIEKLEIEISELKQYKEVFRSWIRDHTEREHKSIREVLRGFFKKLPSYSLSDIHVADIDKWLKTLDGDSKEKWQEHDEACYQYCSTQIDEMLKDGEKSVCEEDVPRTKQHEYMQVRSLPTDSTPSEQSITKIRGGDYIEGVSFVGNKRTDFIIEKEPTDDFIKVESKPYWLIPKDVDDFLRNYPSDGVRIKYDRLLDNLPEKVDLEEMIDCCEAWFYYGGNPAKGDIDTLKKWKEEYLEDENK